MPQSIFRTASLAVTAPSAALVGAYTLDRVASWFVGSPRAAVLSRFHDAKEQTMSAANQASEQASSVSGSAQSAARSAMDAASSRANQAVNAAQDAANQAYAKAQSAGDSVAQQAGSLKDKAAQAAQGMTGSAASETAKAAAEHASSGTGSAILDAAKHALSHVKDEATGAVDAAKHAIVGGESSAASKAAEKAAEAASSSSGGIGGGVRDAASRAMQNASDAVHSAVKNANEMVSGGKEQAQSAADSAQRAASGAASRASEALGDAKSKAGAAAGGVASASASASAPSGGFFSPLTHGLHKAFVEPMFSWTALWTLAFTVLVLIQVAPMVRQNNYDFHKFMGRISFVPFLGFESSLAYTMVTRGLSQGPYVLLLDAMNFLTVLSCWTLGVNAIFVRRDAVVHRHCMLIVAAAVLCVPAQRFFSGFLSQVNVGGSHTTWLDWHAHESALSCALAVASTYGVSSVWGAATDTDARDIARANGPGADEARKKLE